MNLGTGMRLSKRSEYGLKAAVRLALASGAGAPSSSGAGSGRARMYLQSREIAAAEKLPPKFLESILLALRSARLLESKVGAGGGYRLARPARDIRVIEVLDAMAADDPEREADTEPGGSVGCAAVDVVHARLQEATARAIGELSLEELVELSQPGGVSGAREACAA